MNLYLKKSSNIIPEQLGNHLNINEYFDITDPSPDAESLKFYFNNTRPGITSLSFSPTTGAEIFNIFLSMNSRAYGIDGINIALSSIRLSVTFPTWKKHVLFPIPKIPNPA